MNVGSPTPVNEREMDTTRYENRDEKTEPDRRQKHRFSR